MGYTQSFMVDPNPLEADRGLCLESSSGCKTSFGGFVREVVTLPPYLISRKAFLNSLCKSQSPHKSVNLFLILVIVKDKSTDLWGS